MLDVFPIPSKFHDCVLLNIRSMTVRQHSLCCSFSVLGDYRLPPKTTLLARRYEYSRKEVLIKHCFSYNKTNNMHYFLKFIFRIKLYMFRTVPLSIIRSFSLYTHQWYMSHRFADSLRAGSGRNWFGSVLILLTSCQQTCMTYTIAVCTVKNSC